MRYPSKPKYDGSEQQQSEQIKRDYELTEIEVQKIDLQEGDTLMITIKNDYIEPEILNSFRDQFKQKFPNNQVFVIGMDSESEIKYAVISQPKPALDNCSTSPVGYCSDCNCGKKEAAEGSKA
jgi:hypothetical protein